MFFLALLLSLKSFFVFELIKLMNTTFKNTGSLNYKGKLYDVGMDNFPFQQLTRLLVFQCKALSVRTARKAN